jgi:hypothetical protein
MVEIVMENIIKIRDTPYTPKKAPRFYSPRGKKTVLEGGERVEKGGESGERRGRVGREGETCS